MQYSFKLMVRMHFPEIEQKYHDLGLLRNMTIIEALTAKGGTVQQGAAPCGALARVLQGTLNK